MLFGLAIGGLSTGCELLVQLDRSAVVTPDAGCPICSSADASQDTTPDQGVSEDSSLDAFPQDVASEAAIGEH
jgi:hypothetical protein